MKKILAIQTALLLCLANSAWAGPRFKVLAPAEESFIGGEKVLLIGKIDGFSEAKMVEITDNGKTLGFAPLRLDVFTFQARLAPGRHEIVLTAPGVERGALRIFIGKQEGYRYHMETDLEACDQCHEKAGKGLYTAPLDQRDLCFGCHDAVGADRFVHGPVAAGACTPCHDPHGSKNEFFLAATGKDLCLMCHSQNLSREHIEKRRNAGCVTCHDPHSSAKNYHLK